jgi:ABC-type lipoprotein export system ATPase subunit
MDTAIVEARELVKTYDTGAVQVNALKGIDLAVQRGEMVAIMGPSGCGKTTLLNCLSGLDSIDGGDVVIEGVSLAEMSDRERTDYRAANMGFVFQFYNLMPVLSAVENVELPLLVARVPGKKAREQALDALIVWADEPTGDLDSENAAEITDLMRHLNRERGLTFLIVTHDPSVGHKADRIVRMLDGTIVEDQYLEVERVRAGNAA